MYQYINQKQTIIHVPVYQPETNSYTCTSILTRKKQLYMYQYINQKQTVIHVPVY
jgi:hypothetical protein